MNNNHEEIHVQIKFHVGNINKVYSELVSSLVNQVSGFIFDLVKRVFQNGKADHRSNR